MVRMERSLSTGSNGRQTAPVLNSPTPVARPKPPPGMAGRRHGSVLQKSVKDDIGGRVRVAVRLRPRNAEELLADSDFADCIELQPELKRLKLRKNNWDCETFQFDEVLTDTASQKRVYEVVVKPVVESVLEGYNGTIMAYGQTGTGKTFTLGRIGEEDIADRGIMVRAMEDILRDLSSEQDSVSISYLQLYMETVQDLLAPEKDNITILEDPKTGDVSLPGATVVEVRDQRSFISLLQTGEANRFAANTRLNTESSRSHAILLVNVRKNVKAKHDRGELAALTENATNMQPSKGQHIPVVRKSKLLIVDLAGSERIDKSGSDGHTLEEAKYINLSLTALGKCINALAENSMHVPIRDSKLTRILRDSFGGSARTSLIVTVGPSPQHRAETASTIMFGQRAMKVENMVKLKEEFDYKSMCRRLENDLDILIAENERQTKAVLDAKYDMERKLEKARNSVLEAEKKLATNLEETTAEKLRSQKEHMETMQKLEQERAYRERIEKELADSTQNLHSQKERLLEKERERHQKEIQDLIQKHHQELSQLVQKLEAERLQRESLEKKLWEIGGVTRKQADCFEITTESEEIKNLNQKLEQQTKQTQKLEDEVKFLKQQSLDMGMGPYETRKNLDMDGNVRTSARLETATTNKPTSANKDAANGQRATIAKLFEQVGLEKILSLLDSDDADVRVHAVKVVANLAAEEPNQEKIAEAGGLTLLLKLLQVSEDETIRRVAAGAIANLAMNEINQELIMIQGGIRLLAATADEAEDPQTLRMVAGAIANLCGNEKLQVKLREEGGTRALLGMVRSRHPDVLAQVARGIANFAKCESRGFAQGHKKGKSMLIDDGALPWIIANANSEASPIRRHLELALCHLAQQEINTEDLVSAGALWELARISRECSREDIRNLAKRTLDGSPTLQTELRRMHRARA